MDEVGGEAGHSQENVKLLFSRNCQNWDEGRKLDFSCKIYNN